ncbi:hypothetical protein JAAARDRAFT_400535 [Jaapia argillacea MUCL 33604]|uniref:Uncharacterized protein n=1 Tax=Jaapia argillacea MUCL 33604 TaxID=933084 RepID=A0A067PIL6_9AGAM|nr:hypothetical protein JAAARDRAFT_400535 [Jaapia argillacea MUCL 33604]
MRVSSRPVSPTATSSLKPTNRFTAFRRTPTPSLITIVHSALHSIVVHKLPTSPTLHHKHSSLHGHARNIIQSKASGCQVLGALMERVVRRLLEVVIVVTSSTRRGISMWSDWGLRDTIYSVTDRFNIRYVSPLSSFVFVSPILQPTTISNHQIQTAG